MPAGVTENPPDEDQLDVVFQALSDRTRRALISRLASGPALVTELAKPFDLSLAAVSKHLKVLERAGLVEQQIRGRSHTCMLDVEPLREADRWVSRYQSFWEDNLDALASHVERDHDSEPLAKKRRRAT